MSSSAVTPAKRGASDAQDSLASLPTTAGKQGAKSDKVNSKTSESTGKRQKRDADDVDMEGDDQTDSDEAEQLENIEEEGINSEDEDGADNAPKKIFRPGIDQLEDQVAVRVTLVLAQNVTHAAVVFLRLGDLATGLFAVVEVQTNGLFQIAGDVLRAFRQREEVLLRQVDARSGEIGVSKNVDREEQECGGDATVQTDESFHGTTALCAPPGSVRSGTGRT